MFTIAFDHEYESVTLSFKNEFLEFDCNPEDCEALEENGYDSGPSNGDFNFSYDDEKICFYIAKHGDGQGGSLSFELKMTKEKRINKTR